MNLSLLSVDAKVVTEIDNEGKKDAHGLLVMSKVIFCFAAECKLAEYGNGWWSCEGWKYETSFAAGDFLHLLFILLLSSTLQVEFQLFYNPES